MIRYEILLDTILEQWATYADYVTSSKRYKEKHGYGCNIDRAKTPEERHIAHMYYSDWFSSGGVDTCMDLLGYERDERRRARSAARALLRWYNKTAWEKNPPEQLLNRLQRYVEEG